MSAPYVKCHQCGEALIETPITMGEAARAYPGVGEKKIRAWVKDGKVATYNKNKILLSDLIALTKDPVCPTVSSQPISRGAQPSGRGPTLVPARPLPLKGVAL